jgi:phosphosulfolactate synthase
MVMDKGLSLRQTKDFIESAGELTDIVKLGFGTSIVTNNLSEKIKLYQSAGIEVYFGGTLFEAFIARNMFDDYRKLIDQYDLAMVEVSDGSIEIDHEKKCNYIKSLTSQVTVLSEVGYKDSEKIIPPYKWIELMQKEIDAGSWKVIAEAREGGNVGIYRGSGEVRSDLIEEILTKIPSDKILWEAPQKTQQVWFIKLMGSNVNLGNIAPNEVIPLECLRLGLRGDTFFDHLP